MTGAFLGFDGLSHLLNLSQVREATTELGFSCSRIAYVIGALSGPTYIIRGGSALL